MLGPHAFDVEIRQTLEVLRLDDDVGAAALLVGHRATVSNLSGFRTRPGGEHCQDGE